MRYAFSLFGYDFVINFIGIAIKEKLHIRITCLLTALLHAPESVSNEAGICGHLNHRDDRQLKQLLYDIFDKWPECHIKEDGTKNMEYPVGGLDEYVKESGTAELWANIKRIELIKYIHKTVMGNTLIFPTVIISIKKI